MKTFEVHSGASYTPKEKISDLEKLGILTELNSYLRDHHKLSCSAFDWYGLDSVHNVNIGYDILQCGGESDIQSPTIDDTYPVDHFLLTTNDEIIAVVLDHEGELHHEYILQEAHDDKKEVLEQLRHTGILVNEIRHNYAKNYSKTERDNILYAISLNIEQIRKRLEQW